MKLLLALSVVLITLSVLAEPSSADSQESSLTDRVKSIGESIKGAAVKVGEKTKAVLDDLHNSEFMKKTRNFFTAGIESVKKQFSK